MQAFVETQRAERSVGTARKSGAKIIRQMREATVPDDGYEPTEPGSPVGYQYQWWTDSGSDVFMALGLHHQFIRVDPTNKIVIVKTSHTTEPVGRDEENEELFAQITARLTE